MYWLYERRRVPNGLEYTRGRRISLAGSRSGLICAQLRKSTPPSQSEPYEWQFETSDAVKLFGNPDDVVVVDLKPKSGEYVTLFQLDAVYGYSCSGWTPIMLEMAGLLVDEPLTDWNKEFFVIDEKELDDNTVYTFLYLTGTVMDGGLVGRWLYPGPSPTNSALLWRDAREYFISKMKRQENKTLSYKGGDIQPVPLPQPQRDDNTE